MWKSRIAKRKWRNFGRLPMLHLLSYFFRGQAAFARLSACYMIRFKRNFAISMLILILKFSIIFQTKMMIIFYITKLQNQSRCNTFCNTQKFLSTKNGVIIILFPRSSRFCSTVSMLYDKVQTKFYNFNVDLNFKIFQNF